MVLSERGVEERRPPALSEGIICGIHAMARMWPSRLNRAEDVLHVRAPGSVRGTLHLPSPPRPPRTTLQENVGPALTAGLASVAAAQPDDPVEYLAHWLLKYLAIEEKKEKVSTKSTATTVHTDCSKRGLGEEDAGWEATSRCGSSGIGERRHTRRRTGRWSSSCAGC